MDEIPSKIPDVTGIPLDQLAAPDGTGFCSSI